MELLKIKTSCSGDDSETMLATTRQSNNTTTQQQASSSHDDHQFTSNTTTTTNRSSAININRSNNVVDILDECHSATSSSSSCLSTELSSSSSSSTTSSSSSSLSSQPPTSLLTGTDLLKCGSCSTEFLLSDIVIFIQHKTSSCARSPTKDKSFENSLKCSTCFKCFYSADSLLEHAQFTHNKNIFIEDEDMTSQESSSSNRPSRSRGNSSASSKCDDEHETSMTIDENNNAGQSGSTGPTPVRSESSKNEIYIDVISEESRDRNELVNEVMKKHGLTISSSSTRHHSTDQFKILLTSTPGPRSCPSPTSSANNNNSMSTPSSLNMLAGSTKNFSMMPQYPFLECLQQQQNGYRVALDENSSHSRSMNGNKYSSESENSSSSSTLTEDSINFRTKPSDRSSPRSDQLHQQSQHSQQQQQRKKQTKSNHRFLCEICQQVFNQKIHLTKHSAKHTGIKPFKCNECNYSTVERSHLKVHVRVHTGEKPFKCSFCEYATAQSSTLKIHNKRHHEKFDTNSITTVNETTTTTTTTTIKSEPQNQYNQINKSGVVDGHLGSSPVKRFKNYITQYESSKLNDDGVTTASADSSTSISSSATTTANNKLLGLANIALEREESI